MSPCSRARSGAGGAGLLPCLLSCTVLLASALLARPCAAQERGLWGRPVERGGFHLLISFGIGGGPNTFGLFHAMELGGTVGNHTIALLHTFIQNKNFFGGNYGGPDLIGGWMLEYKHPIVKPDLVGKIAFGLGGTHEQNHGKIKAHPGLGLAYGIDLHYPAWPQSGPTLSLQGLNVYSQGQHHFGAGLGAGFTKF